MTTAKNKPAKFEFTFEQLVGFRHDFQYKDERHWCFEGHVERLGGLDKCIEWLLNN